MGHTQSYPIDLSSKHFSCELAEGGPLSSCGIHKLMRLQDAVYAQLYTIYLQ